MAYDTRYEASPAGSIMTGILAWTQTYLKGGDAFTPTTQPTLAQVEQMCDMRTEQVGAIIVQNGYNATQTDSNVLALLTRAIIMGVVMDIEMTKQNQTQNRGESQRWQLFEKRWNELIALFATNALELLGATRDRYASSGLALTGTTWSEQDDIDSDEDAKGAVFPRGYLDTEARRSRYVEISEPLP